MLNSWHISLDKANFDCKARHAEQGRCLFDDDILTETPSSFFSAEPGNNKLTIKNYVGRNIENTTRNLPQLNFVMAHKSNSWNSNRCQLDNNNGVPNLGCIVLLTHYIIVL